MHSPEVDLDDRISLPDACGSVCRVYTNEQSVYVNFEEDSVMLGGCTCVWVFLCVGVGV